jgi:hypothetical protein
MQYYPFKGRPGKNPCLTILSRAYMISYGLAWNATNPGMGKVPEMWCVHSPQLIVEPADAPVASDDAVLLRQRPCASMSIRYIRLPSCI